jgi:myo-inositol-1(or 4)-monophosphatase
VALWRDGGLVWGCVHQPFTGETFTAVRGRGARRNGVPMHATSTASLEAARLYVSRHEHRKGVLAPLAGRVACETVGSCAYKLACVASGACDGTITVNPRSEWDVAAGALLVEEAGGVVTDARGRPYAFNQPGLLVEGTVAAGPGLHAALLDLADVLRGA